MVGWRWRRNKDGWMGVEKENRDGGWGWRKRTKMEGWRAGGGGGGGETGVEAVTVKAELKR